MSFPERPSSCRTRLRRSAESSRSWIVNPGSRPAQVACMRSSRAPMAWNVPDHGSALFAPGFASPNAAATMRWALRSISAAARRENVSSRMRAGSAPLTMRWATRWASVLVLPEPAPAMTRSGAATLEPRAIDIAPRSVPSGKRRPWQAGSASDPNSLIMIRSLRPRLGRTSRANCCMRAARVLVWLERRTWVADAGARFRRPKPATPGEHCGP